VHVRGLPAHRAQQPALVAFRRQVGELDARTIGRQAADDPRLAHGEAGIVGANRLRHQRVGGVAVLRRAGPQRGGRHPGLGFARDDPAAPLSRRHEALAAQAADAGDARAHTVV